MQRRGQGISINVIVIAAIALLILVILSVLAIRSGGILSSGTSCDALGGTCTMQGVNVGGKCNTDAGEFEDRGGFCARDAAGEKQICCRRLP